MWVSLIAKVDVEADDALAVIINAAIVMFSNLGYVIVTVFERALDRLGDQTLPPESLELLLGTVTNMVGILTNVAVNLLNQITNYIKTQTPGGGGGGGTGTGGNDDLLPGTKGGLDDLRGAVDDYGLAFSLAATGSVGRASTGFVSVFEAVDLATKDASLGAIETVLPIADESGLSMASSLSSPFIQAAEAAAHVGAQISASLNAAIDSAQSRFAGVLSDFEQAAADAASRLAQYQEAEREARERDERRGRQSSRTTWQIQRGAVVVDARDRDTGQLVDDITEELRKRTGAGGTGL